MSDSKNSFYNYASITAFAAGLCMVVMLVVMSIFPFSNPLHFEQVKPVSEYTSELVLGDIPLRVVLTIDHMFLIFVMSAFVFAISAIHTNRNKFVTTMILIPIVLTALLDIYENHHVAIMLMSVLEGLPISQNEISQQAVLSLAKFHIGNISYFLYKKQQSVAVMQPVSLR